MLAETDFTPTATKRHKNNQSQEPFATILHQPATKLVLTASQNLLTVFTVVSGLSDSLGNLNEMGVYLGSPHE